MTLSTSELSASTYIFGSTDKVGYAAAISLALLVAVLVLTFIQLRLLRGRRGEA